MREQKKSSSTKLDIRQGVEPEALQQFVLTIGAMVAQKARTKAQRRRVERLLAYIEDMDGITRANAANRLSRINASFSELERLHVPAIDFIHAVLVMVHTSCLDPNRETKELIKQFLPRMTTAALESGIDDETITAFATMLLT